MTVSERMRLCQMIEKMEDQEEYSRKLGLKNKSTFRGESVDMTREYIEVIENEVVENEVMETAVVEATENNIIDVENTGIEEVVGTSKANVLVIGNSGVGKSTLINAVLGEERAETSYGTEGTTKELKLYSNDALSFQLIDTVGFEPTRAKERQAIKAVKKWSKESASDKSLEQPISCIWFCIDGTSAKLFDKTVKNLAEATKMWKSVPIIVVITKSYSETDRATNIEMVQKAFAKNKLLGNLKKIIPVVASTFTLNAAAFVGPEGITELIDATNEILPEGVQAAKKDLDAYKITRKNILSQSFIGVATAGAVVVGAVPIPFADAAILTPVEVGLVNGLAKLYGITESEKSSTFINSIIEVGTVSMAARTAISAIKAIPGLNIAGAALNAVVAGIFVASIGESSKYMFEKVYTGEKSIEDVDWAKKLVESKLSNEMVKKVNIALKSLDGKVDKESIIKAVKIATKSSKRIEAK